MEVDFETDHIVRFKEFRGSKYTVKAFGWHRFVMVNEDWYLYFFDNKTNDIVAASDELYVAADSSGPQFLETTNGIIVYTSRFEIGQGQVGHPNGCALRQRQAR